MEGRSTVEATSAIYAVGLSSESRQADLNPFMSENTLVCLIALLCAVISIVGILSSLPWHYIWRSNEDHMAARLANTGLKKQSIKALPSTVYSREGLELQATQCSICLAEFMEGEKVRVLSNCKHTFHMDCVDRWLFSHSSCPNCRDCLLWKSTPNGADQIQSSRPDGCMNCQHQQIPFLSVAIL